MKRGLVALALLLVTGPVFGFNLLTDIEQQTQWTLGSSVQAGTAMALQHDDQSGVKAGQFVGSALASISNYRMFNLAAGGNFIPQPDGSLKALDTIKLGLNLAYIFKGFTNQPPAFIQNLVIGPSFATSVVTTPHTVIPFFDANYSFGK